MPRPRRSGFSLVELLAVLALLVILGAAILPTISGLYGNTRQKASVDIIRARLADARSKSIEDGRPYRVSLNAEGNRVKMSPEDEFAPPPPKDEAQPSIIPATREDPLEKGVHAVVQLDLDEMAPAADSNGWHTVAVYLPDGTCRDVNAVIEVHEGSFAPILVQIRGVTGSSRLVPHAPHGGHP